MGHCSQNSAQLHARHQGGESPSLWRLVCDLKGPQGEGGGGSTILAQQLSIVLMLKIDPPPPHIHPQSPNFDLIPWRVGATRRGEGGQKREERWQ